MRRNRKPHLPRPRSFELKVLPAEAGTRSAEVRVLIGGRDLIDLAREAELPDATDDGEPGLAGAYRGLRPDQWVDLPEQYGDGRAAVLGCVCGEVGCWPLRVRIRRLGGTVVWSDFDQPNRGWSCDTLGPFVFLTEEYDRAVAAVARAAAP